MIHNNIPKISPLGTDVSLKAIIVNYGKTPFAIILQFTEMRFSLRLPLTKMVLILSEPAQKARTSRRAAHFICRKFGAAFHTFQILRTLFVRSNKRADRAPTIGRQICALSDSAPRCSTARKWVNFAAKSLFLLTVRNALAFV